jgi:phage-related minor tail protein
MKSGTCVKGDHYVNDEARARFWNDRETARLALDMAQQQAGVAKANEDIREAAAESDRQKYAAQAQANYAKTQSALEKYTARQNELNKALKDGRILQADYNINLAAAKKSMRILSRNRRKGPPRSERPPAPGRPIPPPHRRWSLRRSYAHCKSTRVSMTLSASSGRSSGDSRPASPFWKRPQKRTLSAEEKSLLASKDEVLSRAEMNAKLGDQIAAQERLNRLQDTSQKYVTQMGEKTARWWRGEYGESGSATSE